MHHADPASRAAARRGVARIAALLVVIAVAIAIAKWPESDGGSASDQVTDAIASTGTAALTTVPPLPGPLFEDAATGTATETDEVSVSDVSAAQGGELYLTAISTKPARDVVDVTGMDLDWFQVRAQCSGRGSTQIEVWAAKGGDGSGTGSGAVVASLVGQTSSIAMTVARYSGADVGTPIGMVVTANSNLDPANCEDGSDQDQVLVEIDRVDPTSRVVVASALRNTTMVRSPMFEPRSDVTAGEGGGAAGVTLGDVVVPVDPFVEPMTPRTSLFDVGTSSSTDWAAIAVEILPDGYSPAAATLTVSDDRIAFGDVGLAAPARRTVTLRNEGRAALAIDGVTIGGPDADLFAVIGDVAFVLGRDESRDVVVEFRPDNVDENATATIDVASNAVDPSTGVLLTGRGGPLPDGIWISSDELAALPTDGPAWDRLRSVADGDLGVPDLSDFTNRHDVGTLALALVAARTGDAVDVATARDAIMSAIGTESDSTTAVQPCRNVTAYVLAADIIDMRTVDASADRTFRTWIDELRDVQWQDGSFIDEDVERANNHGRMCGAARVVIARYLGDEADLADAALTFAHVLGDTSVGREFVWNDDLSWQADPDHPVGVNPSGVVRDGLDIGGALPEEMRRGASFAIPPVHTTYPWEGLQGIVVEAMVLDRAGYDAFDWSDRAVLRAVEFMDRLDQAFPDSGWWAKGDDAWVPWVINDVYGTTFRTTPAGGGKNTGWTDWTHAPLG